MRTDVKPGTARRLGLRDPQRPANRFRHYPQPLFGLRPDVVTIDDPRLHGLVGHPSTWSGIADYARGRLYGPLWRYQR